MPKIKQKQTESDNNKVQCPHCLLRAHLPLDMGGSKTFAVKGLSENFAALWRGAQAKQIEEANAWVDLTCPHCQQVFHYNLRSGSAR